MNLNFGLCKKITENISRVIVGKKESIDFLLAALLADGHVLIEDIPGLGKTLLAKSLAKSIAGSFRRVQFTPDLLPADITGFNIYHQQTGQFIFQPGPVMANILLADEINRTIPRKTSPEVGLGDLNTSSESGGLPEIVEKIVAWGLGSLLGLVVVGVSCLALFYLFRWLFSRTSTEPKRQSPGLWHMISLWVSRFQTLLVLCRDKLARRLRGYHQATQLYAALLNWGRHSGLPCSPSETPMEYGLRLKHQFPSLQTEIGWIVGAYNQEVYGEIRLDREQLSSSQYAWHRLRSPVHWPSRLKAWLRHPPSFPERSDRLLKPMG